MHSSLQIQNPVRLQPLVPLWENVFCDFRFLLHLTTHSINRRNNSSAAAAIHLHNAASNFSTTARHATNCLQQLRHKTRQRSSISTTTTTVHGLCTKTEKTEKSMP